jgi:hypothetical protein
MTEVPRPRRSCGGVLGTLTVVGAVIVGAVVLSPDLALTDLREAAIDPVAGVPGSGGDGWTYMATTSRGHPVTWPCEGTIEVAVNPEGAPQGYAEVLASAVGRVNGASGFALEVAGETDDRDFRDRGAGPVLVMWADEDEVSELAGLTAGVGGATYVRGPGGGGRAVGGMVVLDTDLPGGFWRRTDPELVLVHELLHVLGLGHSEDPSQLMAPEYSSQRDLGEGDLAGLEALHEAACS